jgi:hypothetical protein
MSETFCNEMEAEMTDELSIEDLWAEFEAAMLEGDREEAKLIMIEMNDRDEVSSAQMYERIFPINHEPTYHE